MLRGSLAGALATAPMTGWMEAAHRLLPDAREPLPPDQITRRAEQVATVDDDLEPEEHRAATLLMHFGYGAACGALYALAPAKLRSMPFSGPLFGLAVWGGSYLGLLPATGLMRSATRQPPTRNALMIVAHLVWGGSMARLANRGDA
jgi:putative membrane protein